MKVFSTNFASKRKCAFTLAEAFSTHAVGQRKCAFTLAEVLITLGIIGIVAAMTMPTLIQKNQDKELISRTKKVYSDINNALLLAQQEYGVVGDNSFLFNATDSSYIVAKNLSKYFKGSSVCQNSSQAGCSKYYYGIKYSIVQLSNDNESKSYNDPSYASRIILPNGAIISLISLQTGCAVKTYTDTKIDEYGRTLKNPDGSDQTTTYESDNCAQIYFDVNGPKNPNQFGRDAYYVHVHRKKGVRPASTRFGGTSLLNILTGKDKLEYTNYSVGQVFDF